MTQGTSPDVAPEEYERRFIAKLRGPFEPHVRTEDVWLEGHFPDTNVVVVLSFAGREGCRYIFRARVWGPGAHSVPEYHAADMAVGVMEWYSAAYGWPSEEGQVYEAVAARAGVVPRRPDLEPESGGD